MSRLTIDITDQQHQNLKATAALQGKTIKQYALARLFPGDADGEVACGEVAWQQLKSLLSDRICESLAGKVSTRSVSEVLDEELAKNSRG
ncbi:antitoxin [Agrobacterium sp. CG674]